MLVSDMPAEEDWLAFEELTLVDEILYRYGHLNYVEAVFLYGWLTHQIPTEEAADLQAQLNVRLDDVKVLVH